MIGFILDLNLYSKKSGVDYKSPCSNKLNIRKDLVFSNNSSISKNSNNSSIVGQKTVSSSKSNNSQNLKSTNKVVNLKASNYAKPLVKVNKYNI